MMIQKHCANRDSCEGCEFDTRMPGEIRPGCMLTNGIPEDWADNLIQRVNLIEKRNIQKASAKRREYDR
jgi:hypothetical protein